MSRISNHHKDKIQKRRDEALIEQIKEHMNGEEFINEGRQKE